MISYSSILSPPPPACKRRLRNLIGLSMLAVSFAAAQGQMPLTQTPGTASFDGGTLTWTVTTTQPPCGQYGNQSFTLYTDGLPTFTPSGGSPVQATTGGGAYVNGSPGPPYCPANGPYSASPVTVLFPYGNASGVNYLCFTPMNYGDGSASELGCPVTSTLYPQYKVTSIIYSAPGNRSSDGYVTSTTDGTSTSIGNTFEEGTSTTLGANANFMGFGGTLSVTFGESQTTGATYAATDTFTQGTGVALNNQSTNPNVINHGQDMFIIWLNPAVSITTESGVSSVGYSMGTQYVAGTNTPQEVDQVEVSADTMEANSSGNSTVPIWALQMQYDLNGHQTLAGLAAICKNQAYYPGNCGGDPNGQCGCVPSDFTAILAQDPLLTYSSTANPLNADTSGVAACTAPTSADSCRYIPANASALLAGPESQGGDIPTNSFTQTDQNTLTQTYSESFSNTQGFSWKVNLLVAGNGPSFANANEMTWTNSESSGAINGTTNSQNVNLSSGTVDCYQEITIYEDTVFHTFVFQQPAGNNSCP